MLIFLNFVDKNVLENSPKNPCTYMNVLYHLYPGLFVFHRHTCSQVPTRRHRNLTELKHCIYENVQQLIIADRLNKLHFFVLTKQTY